MSSIGSRPQSAGASLRSVPGSKSPSRQGLKQTMHVIQVFLAFSSTPNIPRLIRSSLVAPVGHIVERALTVYEEEINTRRMRATDAVPSVIPGDYIVRLAHPDGTPDRAIPHLLLSPSLSDQRVSFPFMLHIALDAQKDAASLHLLPAYTALVANGSLDPQRIANFEGTLIARAHALATSPLSNSPPSQLSDIDRIRNANVAAREDERAAKEAAARAANDAAVRQRLLSRRGLGVGVDINASSRAVENRARLVDVYRSEYNVSPSGVGAEHARRGMLLAADEGVAARMAELVAKREAAAVAAERADAISVAQARTGVGGVRVLPPERLADEVAAVGVQIAVERAVDDARRVLLRQQEELLAELLRQQVHDAAVLDAHRRERLEQRTAARRRARASLASIEEQFVLFGGK